MKKFFKTWSIPLLVVIAVVIAIYFYDHGLSVGLKKPGQDTSTPAIQQQNLEASTPLIGKVTFVIGGDMMFARNISYNYRDDKLVDVALNLGNTLFSGVDLSLVNLEGPISKIPIAPNNTKGLMSFYFPPQTADVLNWLGVNSVSLANNHSNNKGSTALASTKEILTSHNISYIGEEARFYDGSVKEYTFGDKKVSVIAINCLEVSCNISTTVKSEKAKNDVVIVYPHWGIEYDETHSKDQQNLAYQWINAGADMVIGSHPHVVQDMEIYKNRPIFYSLGNLLFDQDFSDPTQRGLIVSGTFSDSDINLTLLPTVSKKYKPELQTGDEKKASLQILLKGVKSESVEVDDSSGKIVLKLGN